MTLRPAALACIAVLALTASPVLPQPAESKLTVTLASFSFSPSTISLVHGQPYALELVNAASGGHNFVAQKFFAAAQVAPADSSHIVKGAIELGGGERVTIHFVAPAAGSYPVKCSHLFHSSFGMTGKIVVS